MKKYETTIIPIASVLAATDRFNSVEIRRSPTNPAICVISITGRDELLEKNWNALHRRTQDKLDNLDIMLVLRLHDLIHSAVSKIRAGECSQVRLDVWDVDQKGAKNE